MCCGGTVATSVTPASEARPIASRDGAASARALRGEQAPRLGMGHGLAGRARGEHVGGDELGGEERMDRLGRRRARGWAVHDARQAVAVAARFHERIRTAKRARRRATVCAVWFDGSRQVWPRSSAAPRPTAKW
jgi:hypothetical protein